MGRSRSRSPERAARRADDAERALREELPRAPRARLRRSRARPGGRDASTGGAPGRAVHAEAAAPQIAAREAAGAAPRRGDAPTSPASAGSTRRSSTAPRWRPGDRIDGPGAVEEPTTTVVVPPGQRAHRDRPRQLPGARSNDRLIQNVRRRPRAREHGADSVLTAVLANRFDAIVREMTNTLFRTGRSAVLNTARDFSCCDRHRRRPAAGRRRGPAGARARRRPADAARCASCTRIWPRATPSSTTIPTSATRTPPTTRSWSRCSSTASTSSPSRRRPTRPTAATPQPTTYMPFATRRLRGGRAHLPLRAGPARLQRRRGHHPHVPRADPGARTSGTATTWRRSARPGSASAGSRSWSTSYGVETLREFVARVARLLRAPDGRRRSASCRRAGLTASGTPRPAPRPARRAVTGQGRRSRSIPTEGEDRRSTCATTSTACPSGSTSPRRARVAGAMIGVFNCLPADVPHNAGSFRRVDVLPARGLDRRRPDLPALGLDGDHERPQPADQRDPGRLRQLGDGHGLAEGAGAMGAGFAVVSGDRPDAAAAGPTSTSS